MCLLARLFSGSPHVLPPRPGAAIASPALEKAALVAERALRVCAVRQQRDSARTPQNGAGREADGPLAWQAFWSRGNRGCITEFTRKTEGRVPRKLFAEYELPGDLNSTPKGFPVHCLESPVSAILNSSSMPAGRNAVFEEASSMVDANPPMNFEQAVLPHLNAAYNL